MTVARRRSNQRASNEIERRVQYLYDDKTCLGVIEPHADGRWHAVKSGKEIGTYRTRSEAYAAVMDEWRGRI
jgi:hypothetical protein